MQVLLYNHCECERGHYMEIQAIIKNRRNELGLTLKDVAKALGVSEGTVSRYESSDIQNMGIDKLVPLAKVLKCSPGYLMGWKDSPSDTVLSDESLRIARTYENADDMDKEMVRRILKINA